MASRRRAGWRGPAACAVAGLPRPAPRRALAIRTRSAPRSPQTMPSLRPRGRARSCAPPASRTSKMTAERRDRRRLRIRCGGAARVHSCSIASFHMTEQRLSGLDRSRDDGTQARHRRDHRDGHHRHRRQSQDRLRRVRCSRFTSPPDVAGCHGRLEQAHTWRVGSHRNGCADSKYTMASAEKAHASRF